MSEICCICLRKSIFFQSVSECVFGKVKYIEKLSVCVPNELWEESFNICNDCVEKLDGAYNFVQLCLKSQEWRKEQMTFIGVKNSLLIRPKKESSTGFTCYQCSKSFRLKSTLSIHITKIHTRSKKNIKEKSLEVKYKTDINSKSKKDEKKLDICLEDKGNLEILENKLEIKYDKPFKLENEEEINDSSSYEVYDHENNYLSEEEIKEKKGKGKKRGPPTKGPFICDTCNLVFNRPYKLKHHVRAKHTFEKPFKCELCDAKYLKRDSLNVHMRKHNNEKPFICSTCGKSFVTSSDITRHNKTHEEVRQYGCTDCNKSFKTKSNLRTHKLQMHQDPGMWKFICTVCGKRFPLNDALVKHMRRHEGIKDFACHLCNKKFTENGELRRHLLSHSDERNFKCNLCEKAYKKKEILNIHLKRDHGIGNCVIRQPEKKFACPLCPKVFAVNHKLKRHFLTHTGEKPVTCEFCDKRFRDNYDRNVHLRKDHNVEPKTLMCI